MVYPIPAPGYGYGPYFDGRYSHGLVTNPELNGIFESVNYADAHINSGSFLAGVPMPPPGYNANLAYISRFDGLMNQAFNTYHQAMQQMHQGQGGHGGGQPEQQGGIFAWAGRTISSIVQLPGQILAAPFRWIGLDFVGDIIEAPGKIVGGIVEGVGNFISSIF